MPDKPKYSKATPPNDCAHLVQGGDAEVYRSSDLKRMPDTVSWCCCWGETIDLSKFSEWARWPIKAGGPTFQPHKHCPGCSAYVPLGDTSTLLISKGGKGLDDA